MHARGTELRSPLCMSDGADALRTRRLCRGSDMLRSFCADMLCSRSSLPRRTRRTELLCADGMLQHDPKLRRAGRVRHV